MQMSGAFGSARVDSQCYLISNPVPVFLESTATVQNALTVSNRSDFQSYSGRPPHSQFHVKKRDIGGRLEDVVNANLADDMAQLKDGVAPAADETEVWALAGDIKKGDPAKLEVHVQRL